MAGPRPAVAAAGTWFWRVVLSVTVALPLSVQAHTGDTQPYGKSLTAVRLRSTPPVIDGVLDDAAWRAAPVFSGLTQWKPNEGQPSQERTTVRLVYDEEALYVAVMAYDRQPTLMVARPTRRDVLGEAERIEVILDTRHDHQTARWFRVNASGSQLDGHISQDGRDFGLEWNGVWEAEPVLSDSGWSVEFKIPYRVLRFSPAEESTWGINLNRYISRTRERSFWAMVPTAERRRGFVSRFAHLHGIEGIRPARSAEVQPYFMGRSTWPEDDGARDLFGNAGADVRYGVTSSVTFNATVNPDFGQVEADPEVLNLTAFETFQQERRPFFVEGGDLFETPIQLFYSRRIGRNPGHFAIPDGYDTVDRPFHTTILGATRLTGKTARGTSFAVTQALTTSEHARLETTLVDAAGGLPRRRRRDALIEPWTHFLVGRVRHDLFSGTSYVGGIGTALNRRYASSAYSAGVDWDLRWDRDRYGFGGQVAAARGGFGQQLELRKQSGWLWAELSWEAYSADFEIDDLGYLRRNDFYEPGLEVALRQDEIWGPFRSNALTVYRWGRWNFDRDLLEDGIEVELASELRSFWTLGAHTTHHFRALDDRDTRGGPLIVRPASDEYGLSLTSDKRGAFQWSLDATRGRDSASGHWHQLGSETSLRLASNFELGFKPSLDRTVADAQWIANVDADADGVTDHHVYGRLRSRTLDLTTRLNVLFTRDLSLELYAQPFLSVGDFSDPKELAHPASYEFVPYDDLEDDPDFRSRSLQSNMVLRWEYERGCALFLVWSRSPGSTSSSPRFRPVRDLTRSLADDGTDILLIKLNHWIGL